MKLVLIRHSQSIINPDIPIVTWGLSDKGVELAKNLHNNSHVKQVQVIYASFQPKALETAILATKNAGVSVKPDDRLTEITSFTNRFIADSTEYKQSIDNFYSGRAERLSGGESAREALKRFTQAVREIVDGEKSHEVVGIVSHGNILAHFVCQFTENNVYQVAESMKQPDIAVLDWETKKFEVFFGEGM